jgi:molybdopterin molybdotransferase
LKRRDFISYEESLKRLETLYRVGRAERVPLQNSLDRVLAEDIVAKENSPSAPTSSLDGYAIQVLDQNREYIDVLDSDNPAGSELDNSVTTGVAIKTFTGSLMPSGSDTLIPIENVREIDGKLYIDKKVSIGNGVRPVGELHRAGDIILKKGTVVEYVEIGVLASLNIGTISVYQKPRVAILSTGNEILEVGEEQTTSSQIRSSNHYTLEAMVIKYGGTPVQLGIVKDDINTLTEALQGAVDSGAEFIVTTGGVSVGDYDFVSDVVERLGFKTLFHGVKIKPGQHILLASNGKQTLLSLPGFAYSSTVTGLLYLVPLIRSFIGVEARVQTMKAKLGEKFYKRSPKTEFTACNLSFNNGEIVADFNSKKIGTSAILSNLLNSAHLIYTPEDGGNKEIGEIVEVVSL